MLEAAGGTAWGLEGDREGFLGSFPPQPCGVVLGPALTCLLPCQFYLCCQQFYAMFMKRAMYSWRNWKMVAAQFLVPLIFTAFALIVAKTFPGPRDSSLLRLTLEPYGQTIVPFSVPATSALSQKLAEQYVELLDAQRQAPLEVLGKAWQGTRAMPSDVFWGLQASLLQLGSHLMHSVASCPAQEGPMVGSFPSSPGQSCVFGAEWATRGFLQVVPVSSRCL